MMTNTQLTALRTGATAAITALAALFTIYPHLLWIPAVIAVASAVGIHAIPAIQQNSAINTELDKLQMTETQTQTDINNAVTVFTGLFQDLANDNASILTDLTTLANSSANGTPPDTSALDALVAQSQSVQDGLDNAVTQLNTLAAPPTTTTPVAQALKVSDDAVTAHVAPELTNPVGDKGAALMGITPVTPAKAEHVVAAPQAAAETTEAAGTRSEVAGLINTAIDALKAVASKM
jgi:hypothetical protein